LLGLIAIVEINIRGQPQGCSFYLHIQQRASAHGLVNPVEIKAAFDGLIKTGDELGLAMPVTKSFQADMERFALSENA